MIVLDYRDKRPIYEQVVEKLEHLIICGGLEANSKLPSVRTLAMELSVNPNTIQRAYAQLEQDGYIYTVIGRGGYVTARCEWQSGKFEALKKDYKEILVKAHDAGMPMENLIDMIHEIYGDSSQNTDHGNTKHENPEHKNNVPEIAGHETNVSAPHTEPKEVTTP